MGDANAQWVCRGNYTPRLRAEGSVPGTVDGMEKRAYLTVVDEETGEKLDWRRCVDGIVEGTIPAAGIRVEVELRSPEAEVS